MMKNKELICSSNNLKVFKKIITIPIENEKNCMSAKDLEAIAKKINLIRKELIILVRQLIR